MKKKYLISGILLVIAVMFYIFTPSLETIVKKVINKYGSEIIGTEVNLKGFNLSLSNGEGNISEITIANPQKYNSPYLFKLNQIHVKVDLKSLTSNTIIIDEILINHPEITYEMLSLTQNNISEILKNIENYGKTDEKASQESKKSSLSKDSSKSSEKKVIIKNLIISEGNIGIVLPLSSDGKKVSVTLPEIQMQGIGSNNKAESIPQTIVKVFNKILQTISQTVLKSKVVDLKEIAQKNLNSVVGGVKDRIKSIGIFGK